jgi:hypothetical protein
MHSITQPWAKLPPLKAPRARSSAHMAEIERYFMLPHEQLSEVPIPPSFRPTEPSGPLNSEPCRAPLRPTSVKVRRESNTMQLSRSSGLPAQRSGATRDVVQSNVVIDDGLGLRWTDESAGDVRVAKKRKLDEQETFAVVYKGAQTSHRSQSCPTNPHDVCFTISSFFY